jgi:hypothetical protein
MSWRSASTIAQDIAADPAEAIDNPNGHSSLLIRISPGVRMTRSAWRRGLGN